MSENTPPENKPPLLERVGRKFSFLNIVAFALLFVAVIVSAFK